MSKPKFTVRKMQDGQILHIEAPGVIVNIHAGLTDREGREVTHVSVSADGDRYAGEDQWWVATDDSGSKVEASGVGVRIIKGPKPRPAALPAEATMDRPPSGGPWQRSDTDLWDG